MAPQAAGELFGVEAHEKSIARTGRGGTQIAGGADHVLRQLGVCGGTISHVEMHESFPPRHVDMANRSG